MRRIMLLTLAIIMMAGIPLNANEKGSRDPHDRLERDTRDLCRGAERAPASITDKALAVALNPIGAFVRVTLAATKTAEKEHDIYDHTQGGNRESSKGSGTKESGGLSERSREKMENPKQ